MTRDELIEKVVKVIIRRFGDGNPKRCATEIISELFDALKEPTEDMIAQGYNSDDFVLEPSECWQAMLNASPLAKEG